MLFLEQSSTVEYAYGRIIECNFVENSKIVDGTSILYLTGKNYRDVSSVYRSNDFTYYAVLRAGVVLECLGSSPCYFDKTPKFAIATNAKVDGGEYFRVSPSKELNSNDVDIDCNIIPVITKTERVNYAIKKNFQIIL